MTSQLYNNVSDALLNSIDNAQTSFDLVSGNVPAVASGDYIPIYVIRSTDGAFEIMHVTDVSGANVTVTRGAEGSSPLTFPSGDSVQIRPTRQSLLDMENTITTSSGNNQGLSEALDQRVIHLKTIGDMKALDTSSLKDGQAINIMTTGRAGVFVVKTGDFSTEISDDPQSGIWVAFNDNPTGSSLVAMRSHHGEFNPLWFGAVGDGVADDTVAVQATLDAAETLLQGPEAGHRVFFPAGHYLVSNTINQWHNVGVRGEGRSVSFIVAAPSFPDPYVWRVETDRISFNSPFEDMGINCNDQGCTGYYSDRVNELGGLERVFVTRFTGNGVHLVHAGSMQAQNYTLRDLELYISDQSTGGATALIIDGGGADTRGIDGITVNRIGNTSNGDSGIVANGLRSAVLSRLNLEGVQNGLILGQGSSCIGFSVNGVNGNANVTNLIKISSNNEVDGYSIRAVASSGSTNSLVDEHRSLVITRNRIAEYVSGQNDYLLTDLRDVRNKHNKVLISDSLAVGADSGGINRGNVVKTGVTASGGTANIIVEVDSTASGSISIGGKCIVDATFNVRHHEEKSFGLALQSDGTVAGVVTGAQAGTSSGNISIGAPQPLSTPTANFFRIPVTNNTASDTVLSISVDLSVQSGHIVECT